MIIAPKTPQGHLASAWTAGVALMVLLVGVHGAVQPLLPRMETQLSRMEVHDEVMLEAFTPPSAAEEKAPDPESIPKPDVEIPPLPVMQPPLKPPEMVELTPLEDPPAPAPPKPLVPKPKPPAATINTAGKTSGSTGVTTFTGGGRGNFPSPSYPATARANKEQGTVKLLVTVEANGLPSNVSVQSSSGFSALDTSARDQISRRWRWPSGEMRRYLVPVRFVLQP